MTFNLLEENELGICLCKEQYNHNQNGYHYVYRRNKIQIYFRDKGLKPIVEGILKKKGITFWMVKSLKFNPKSSPFRYTIYIKQIDKDPEGYLNKIKKLLGKYYVRKK